MNPQFEMVLRWARQGRDEQFVAWGYLLARPVTLDAVEMEYARNIIMARIAGVSA